VPADRAASCVAALRDQGLPAAQVGEIVARADDATPIELF
jgi:hypothetical protein